MSYNFCNFSFPSSKVTRFIKYIRTMVPYFGWRHTNFLRMKWSEHFSLSLFSNSPSPTPHSKSIFIQHTILG